MKMDESIRTYILENYLFTDDPSALGDDDSLLERGVIDSTGVLELVMYLEEQFGISVQDEDLTPRNLDSVNAIVAFVGRKLAAGMSAEGAA